MSKIRKSSEVADIFISHLSTESMVAAALKDLIEGHLTAHGVFVSSVRGDLHLGKPWLREISAHLLKCKAIIILCSPASITKPWINFEAGAGWIRDVPVIPVCYSGADPANLPSPHSERLGILATDEDAVCALLSELGQVLQYRRSIEVSASKVQAFIEAVRQFECRDSECSEVIKIINENWDVRSELHSRLRKVRRELWMCGVHFAIAFSEMRSEIIEAARRGVAIKIASLDPESSALAVTAESYGMKLNELASECRDSIGKIANIKEELADVADRIQAVTYSSLPRARYYLMDPDEIAGIVFYTPYVENRRSSRSPTMVLRATSDAAIIYSEQVRQLFSSGTPIP